MGTNNLFIENEIVKNKLGVKTVSYQKKKTKKTQEEFLGCQKKHRLFRAQENQNFLGSKIELASDKKIFDMVISLAELGLNKYEERVYLTLIEEGVSSAKNISDITGIPYGKVYEVMNNLSSKGFLIILPTKPMKFQAVSPKEAVCNAKKGMSEKLDKLESKMIKELEPLFAKTKKFSEPKSMFWVINGRSNVNNKIEELIKKSKESINIVTSENGFKRLVLFRDSLKAANKRGVKIKVNATLTADNKQDAKDLDFCDLRSIGLAHNHFFSVDNSECLVVDPISDDESLVQGRDIGMWIMSGSFTKFMDDMVHSQINPTEFNVKR